MAACDDRIVKQDSGRVGLRYEWEKCAKVLPDVVVWKPCEPNSFSDFGSQITTVARAPISAGRQRKKGVPTDMDASGGFNQDVTTGGSSVDLLQGFFFANIRQKMTTIPMNGEAVPLTAVTATEITAADGLLGFKEGDIVMCSGFSQVANNGLKQVMADSTATALELEGLVAEPAPPVEASVRVVGFWFDDGEASIEMNGNLVRLMGPDMDLFNVIPGEWVHIGGDNGSFTVARGFARISRITPDYWEFDKVTWAEGVDEAGTGLEIEIFFADLLRNEPDPDDIVDRTIQFERTVGYDYDGQQSEYLLGCSANQMTMNLSTGAILNVDVTYVALDNEQRTGAQGLKPGTRPRLASGEAFNSTNDVYQVRVQLLSEIDASPKPLYAYAEEASLVINNNVTGEKAIGVFGSFATNIGIFEVSGSITAYFTTIEAVQAVRRNSDVTMHMIFAKNNVGNLWDLPLISLGNGRLDVQLGQSIKLPLDITASENKFGTTLVYQNFPYLPNMAMPA
jgi:hypothetical protein